MTVLLMKNTPVGRRAYAISLEEAKQMVADGQAVQDANHTSIYEEVTDAEREQGYMTRSMVVLSPVKRRGRPAKSRPGQDVNHDSHDEVA